VRIFALHLLTPVDETTTIDRWMHARNTATDVEGVEDQMDAMFRVAFDEDKTILEAMTRQEARAGKRPQIDIASDVGAKLYRRTVQKMLEAEAG
jgi:hypothetical protein